LDMYAIIKYKNGKMSRQEFYNGSSFLSQSGRFFNIENNMESVTITDSNGHQRNLQLN